MTLFLNKKNKAHIYDILNKYFKSEFEYYFIYTKNVFTNNKFKDVTNKVISLKSTDLSINDDSISILLNCLEIDITIILDYKTKIEIKGNCINISIPYENISGYELIVRIHRARTLDQKAKDEIEFKKYISSILNSYGTILNFQDTRDYDYLNMVRDINEIIFK